MNDNTTSWIVGSLKFTELRAPGAPSFTGGSLRITAYLLRVQKKQQ
jgi:hypothetical protein